MTQGHVRSSVSLVDTKLVTSRMRSLENNMDKKDGERGRS